MKIIIDESNPMKCQQNFQSGILCSTFYLLIKIVLEWELEVFLKYNKKMHYEKKRMFPKVENHDRWRVIL
jgi:hypothetical protein